MNALYSMQRDSKQMEKEQMEEKHAGKTLAQEISGNTDFMVKTLAHLQGYEVKKSKSPDDSQANSREVYCHDPVNSMPFTMLNNTDINPLFKITMNTSGISYKID